MNQDWFVSISKKEQELLFNDAIKKAGSERKLEKALGIPDISIYSYKKGKAKPTLRRFRQTLSFLGLSEQDLKFELINPTDYRKKGGKAVYEKYLRENRFNEIHAKMKSASSRLMKEWHAKMKHEHEEEYYKIQYNRFKKIAGYKIKTKKGHFVRNSLEKEVADCLFESGVDYEYEPYLKTANAVYFPDFRFGKTIIECTMWRGSQKAVSLVKKIAEFENTGNTIKVVVPDTLKNFYKPIEKNVINIEQLRYFLKARVAQTGFGFENSILGAAGRASDC